MPQRQVIRGRARARELLLRGAFPVALLACGAPRIDKPSAPDMSRLVDDYEHPSATFDPSDAPGVIAAAAAVDGLLAQTDLRAQLVDVLDEVLDQADDYYTEDGTIDTNGALDLRIRANGYMQVTRICSGWVSPETPDRDANGVLLITATFSRSSLDPIVWGSVAACRYLAAESRIEIEPASDSEDAVSVYWGEAVERQELEERALLVDLNLIAEIDGERLPLQFDFRSLSGGTLEYRLVQGERALIAQIADGAAVKVRAANGTFDCDTDLTCRPSGGGEP
jgi:hypothetical protein